MARKRKRARSRTRSTRSTRSTRRTRSTKSRKRNEAIKSAAAAVVGGAGGALAGGLLVRAGVKPTTAAVGVTIAGGVAAATTKGLPRLAAGGAAAAGAGQLALTWLAARQSSQGGAPVARPRQGLGDEVEQAFDAARRQLAIDDELVEVYDSFDDAISDALDDEAA